MLEKLVVTAAIVAAGGVVAFLAFTAYALWDLKYGWRTRPWDS